MAITTDDFNKIWASTSPLTPYEFSESQYKEGWNFIGGTPPSRQMWDFLQKNNDEKMQYLADNYLPLSGGTLTGDVDITGDLSVSGAITGNADTATNATNDANGNPIASTYLPLAGGTMTGSIQYVDNGKVFAIDNTDPGNVDLGWNLVNREGAVIGLKSADHLKNPGEFSLFARDSANSCTLIGKPDGTLTWGDKEVERVNASGSKYIRYENGLQICWDSVQATSSGTQQTFDKPFSDAPWVVVSANGYNISSGHKNESSTGFVATTNQSSGAWVSWIAIGKWK